jgi:hypothetical protein
MAIGQLRMGMRHVDRGALVAHVDDADAAACHMIPDRLDVAALQAEDAIDAARLEEARDPGRTRGLVGIEVDGAHGGGSEQRVLSTRCMILPVAVRGILSSPMKDTDRGRL